MDSGLPKGKQTSPQAVTGPPQVNGGLEGQPDVGAEKRALDMAVLLLTKGMGHPAVATYLTTNMSVPAAQAEAVVKEARRRLTVAAEFDRDEEIGKAVLRLEDLFRTSLLAKDTRTALQAQRELSRLLRLYDRDDPGETPEEGEHSEAEQRLHVVEGYLLPLKLTNEEYPVEEHARVAADIIRRQGLRAE